MKLLPGSHMIPWDIFITCTYKKGFIMSTHVKTVRHIKIILFATTNKTNINFILYGNRVFMLPNLCIFASPPGLK